MRAENRDARIKGCTAQLIPRVVYSTVREKRLKKKHFAVIEKFRSTNPEYKFVVLDDQEAHDYLASKFSGEKILDLFERSLFGPMRADILRVALMLFEGGVYIDISKHLRIPLQQTIPASARFVFAHEHNEIPSHIEVNTNPRILDNHRKLIVQWCMMSCPNNPVFETMVELIERDSNRYENKVFSSPKQAILELTATYQYTRAVWHHLMPKPIDFVYAGFDFNESSYVLIPESFSRRPFHRHYASKKNSKILESDRRFLN